mmetsp:Transcript_3910/g.6827  ORF Transcript_3910/g.6827 Transcript_3910/m.6827 type:complete len:82 (+) Transcript_3910:216-461(+)
MSIKLNVLKRKVDFHWSTTKSHQLVTTIPGLQVINRPTPNDKPMLYMWRLKLSQNGTQPGENSQSESSFSLYLPFFHMPFT